jgi:hypothetical protein
LADGLAVFRTLPMMFGAYADWLPMKREEIATRAPFWRSHDRLNRVVGAGLIGAVAAGALSGCGIGDGPGALFVDPGRYVAYHCNELADRWKQLLAREKELRNLMDKASEGGGGVVIGTLAYRSDYESVKTEQKLLQRTAAEKKCDLVGASSNYQSDQTIR